jgi:hypothetical protein
VGKHKQRKKEKVGQTKVSGEGQGLHTRWHWGTGIALQSHSVKQEGPGPTSAGMPRRKSPGLSDPSLHSSEVGGHKISVSLHSHVGSLGWTGGL